MSFREFTGELDPPSGSFVPFTGELDVDAPPDSTAAVGALGQPFAGDPARRALPSGVNPSTGRASEDPRRLDRKPEGTWEDPREGSWEASPKRGEAITGELASLRDAAFTGVDQGVAAVRNVNAVTQIRQLQATEEKLRDLEARGQGDSLAARALRREAEGLRAYLPEAFGKAAEAQATADRGAAMTTRPAVQKVAAAKTWGEAWEAFKESPYDVIAGVTAQSFPQILPALITGAVAGPVAGALTMGVSSGAVEAGSSLAEFARERGVNTSDGKAVQTFFSEPQNLSEGLKYAGTRAGIIGAVDAASGGLASKVLAPPMRSAVARQAANVPAQMAAQAAAGGGGEAAAQLATKGEIEPGQVLLEAAGELGGAPAEVLAFGRDARKAAAKPDPVAPILSAPTVDSAIAAAQAATSEPIAAPPVPAAPPNISRAPAASVAAVDRIGQILAPDLQQPTADIQRLEQETINASPAPAVPPADPGSGGSGMPVAPAGVGAGVGIPGPAGGAVEPAGVGSAPAGAAVPPGAGGAAPALTPVAQWFGRRGDGYQTPEDAQAALPSRQRVEPDLSWRIEAMPNGRYRLAGYAAEKAETVSTFSPEPVSTQPSTPPVAVPAPVGESTYEAAPPSPPVTQAPAQDAAPATGGVPVDVAAPAQSVAPVLDTAQPAEVAGGAGVSPAPAPDFTATLNPSGTITIKGDPDAIKAYLKENGITGAAKHGPDTVIVGTKQAKQAEALFPDLTVADRGGDPFRTFLMRQGVALRLAKDFAPGTRERLAMGKTFREGGMELDALAERAAEQGFIRDRMDTDALYDLIARSVSGERIAPQTGEDAELELRARMDRQRELERAAAEKVSGLSEESLEFLDENDDNIPWGDVQSNATEAEAMRALGFTDQEIESAAAQGPEGTRQAGEGGARPVETATREAQGNREGREGEAQGLTSPTREDILAQQSRKENEAALDEKAQIDREAEGFTLQQQRVPEQRRDTTGDLLGGPTAEDVRAAKKPGKAKDDDGTAPMFARGQGADEISPGADFWSKIKAGESFTAEEAEHAWKMGRSGPGRQGRVRRGPDDLPQRVRARATAEWTSEGSAFGQYLTLARATGADEFSVFVIPSGLIANPGLDLAETAGASVVTYVFAKAPSGSYEVSVLDPQPGGAAEAEMQKLGLLREDAGRDVEGAPYSRVAIGTKQSRQLLREAIRRLAMHAGEVPSLEFPGRDTGARAGKSDGGRSYSPKKVETHFAKGQSSAPGLTPSAFTAALTEAFGPRTAQRLQSEGVVVPLADQSELPAHVVPFLRSGDIVYGFYDPKTNRTYAVLKNLDAGMVKGLALHEIGVHYGFRAMLGDAKYDNVMKRLDVMHRAGSKSVRAARADAIENAAVESQVPEETLAYLVQNHPELSLVQEVISRIKAFLYSKFNIGADKLTEADLVVLARAAVHHSARTQAGGVPVPAFMRSKVTPLNAASAADRLAALGYSVERGYEDEPAWIEHQDGTQYDWNDEAGRFEDEKGNPLPKEAADIAQYIGNQIDGFEPEQDIAGAANDRNIDPFKPKFSRTNTAQQGAEGWTVPESSRTDNLIFEMQDGRIDLKRVQEAIKESGREIAEQYDARLAETLYPGRVAYRTQRFIEDEVRPLMELMAAGRVTLTEIGDYLIARHAPERNEQIASINPDLPDGGAGRNSAGTLMTKKAAKEYIEAIPASRLGVLKDVAARIDRITAGTRGLLVSEGLEKPETIKAWEAAYKFYAPLYKEEADAGTPHPIGTGFSVKGSASKRATGSTKQVTDVLGHVLMQREAAITRAEKNRVLMSLYGMVLSHPNPDFWAAIRPGMSPAKIRAQLEAMGVDADEAMASMEGVPTIRMVDEKTNKVVDRPNPIYKSMPNAMVLKIAGEDRVIMLNAKDDRAMRMAENMKNLDGLTKLDIAGSIVGKATRWMASVNTQYNPIFGYVNVIRDVQNALVNLSTTPLRGHKVKILGNVPDALIGIARDLRNDSKRTEWSDLFREFQEAGGRTGYRELFREASDRTKAIEQELASLQGAGKLSPAKAAHAVLDLLDDFNSTLENAVRLSAYKAGLDNGMSKAAAARVARELTVDFNRKGRAGREIGPIYAFFNASMQGTARTLETLRGPGGAMIIAGGIALGMLQALMLAAAGFDDDDIPEWVKARNLIIPTAWRSHSKTYISIPLGLGLHVLPNTGRLIAEIALGPQKDIGKKVVAAVSEIASAFNPLGGGNIMTPDGALKAVAPTVVDPMIEVIANRNFAGFPIERRPFNEEGDNRPGAARARESTQRSATGQVYLGISKAVNYLTGGTDYEAGAVSWTPERYRYLAHVAGGGVLREFERAVNSSIETAAGRPVKVQDIPLVGRFFGEVDGDAVESARFYEAKNKLNRLHSSLKAAEKAGDAEAQRKLLADHPELEFYESMSAAQRSISALNRKAVETVNDREEMKRIDAERVQYMKEFNDALRDLEKGQTIRDRIRALAQ